MISKSLNFRVLDRVFLTRSLVLLSLAVCLLCAVSCAPRTKTNVHQEPIYFEHQVKYSGETLAVISRWYTGESSNWRGIVDANPGLQPEKILIGDVIKIPEEMIVRSEPLPKQAVPAVVSDKTAEEQSLEKELQALEAAKKEAAAKEEEAQKAAIMEDDASKELLAELEALDESSEADATADVVKEAVVEESDASIEKQKTVITEGVETGEPLDASPQEVPASVSEDREDLLDELLEE